MQSNTVEALDEVRNVFASASSTARGLGEQTKFVYRQSSEQLTQNNAGRYAAAILGPIGISSMSSLPSSAEHNIRDHLVASLNIAGVPPYGYTTIPNEISSDDDSDHELRPAVTIEQMAAGFWVMTREAPEERPLDFDPDEYPAI